MDRHSQWNQIKSNLMNDCKWTKVRSKDARYARPSMHDSLEFHTNSEKIHFTHLHFGLNPLRWKAFYSAPYPSVFRPAIVIDHPLHFHFQIHCHCHCHCALAWVVAVEVVAVPIPLSLMHLSLYPFLDEKFKIAKIARANNTIKSLIAPLFQCKWQKFGIWNRAKRTHEQTNGQISKLFVDLNKFNDLRRKCVTWIWSFSSVLFWVYLLRTAIERRACLSIWNE